MTADELAENLNIPRKIAQGLLDSRRTADGRFAGPELFIDDPYLADTLSQRIGMSRQRLFGFDPLAYYDDAGNPVKLPDGPDWYEQTGRAVEDLVSSERARRVARIAARQGRRTGKANLYDSETGDVNVRILEDRLNVKLTDDNGNLLNPSALERLTRDTGLGWGGEKWRRIFARGGQLTPLDIQQLVDKKLLDEGMLPQRDDKSFGEVFQWPGFAKNTISQVINALQDVLGVDRAELDNQRRTIQEALTLARKNQRKAVATRNLQASKLKLTKAKIDELLERLGLDADDFDRWFSGG
jgi:hypothetical protein